MHGHAARTERIRGLRRRQKRAVRHADARRRGNGRLVLLPHAGRAMPRRMLGGIRRHAVRRGKGIPSCRARKFGLPHAKAGRLRGRGESGRFGGAKPVRAEEERARVGFRGHGTAGGCGPEGLCDRCGAGCLRHAFEAQRGKQQGSEKSNLHPLFQLISKPTRSPRHRAGCSYFRWCSLHRRSSSRR